MLGQDLKFLTSGGNTLSFGPSGPHYHFESMAVT